MKITTSQDTFGPGILAAQHHGHEADGYSLDGRACILVTRIVGRRDKKGQALHWKHERDRTADLTGTLIWPKDTRPIPAATFAFPVSTSKTQPKERPHPKRNPRGADLLGETFYMEVLKDRARVRDHALDTQPTSYPLRDAGRRIWPRLPVRDFIGVAVSAQNEDTQIGYFMPTDPRQIAVNHTGDVEIGSWVCDLEENDGIDLDRTARLHTHERVLKKPQSQCVNFKGQNVVGLQLATTGRGDGHAAWYDHTVQKIGHPSATYTGLVDCGCPGQHLDGVDSDGHRTTPVHGNLNTLWTNRAEVDGPERYDGPELVDPPPAPHKVKVKKIWNQSIPHTWCGGVGQGKLIWYSYSHKYIPWIPWEPPTDKPPTRTPPDVPLEPDRSGGGGGGGGSNRGGDSRRPVEAGGLFRSDEEQRRADAEVDRRAREELERENAARAGVPFDPSGGLAPFPGGPPPTSGEEALVDLPIGLGRDLLDPNETFQGWNEKNTWTLLPVDSARFESKGRQWQPGNRPAPASAELQPAYITEQIWRAHMVAADAPDARRPRGDGYSERLQRAIDTQMPAVIRQIAVAARQSTAPAFNKTVHRGLQSPHPGGSANGAILFVAPERDAADYLIGSKPSRTTSTGYIALMDDVCLAFASGVNQATMRPRDGLITAPEGSSGKRNVRDQFFNASGTQRTGYRLFDAVVVGGSTGAMIGLGQHTDTQLTESDDGGSDTLYVQIDTQIQYYALAAGSGAWSYTIYVDDADGEGSTPPAGAAFNLNLHFEADGGNTITVHLYNGGGPTDPALSLLDDYTSDSSDRTIDVLLHFDGTAWRVKLAVESLTQGLAIDAGDPE